VGAVLVTVAGPGSRIDVSLPTGVPVGDIVPALVGRYQPQPPPWSRWALGPPEAPLFSSRRTLAELRVVEGAELQLRDMVSSGGGRDAAPGATPREIVAGGDERRRRICDLTERLIDDLARIHAGQNPLLEYAAPDARRHLRALTPGPLDRAPQSVYADLSLAVSWPRNPRTAVEALATCDEMPAGDGAPPLGGSRPASTPAATPPRGLCVRMTVDPDCRHLLEVSVTAAGTVR